MCTELRWSRFDVMTCLPARGRLCAFAVTHTKLPSPAPAGVACPRRPGENQGGAGLHPRIESARRRRQSRNPCTPHTRCATLTWGPALTTCPTPHLPVATAPAQRACTLAACACARATAGAAAAAGLARAEVAAAPAMALAAAAATLDIPPPPACPVGRGGPGGSGPPGQRAWSAQRARSLHAQATAHVEQEKVCCNVGAIDGRRAAVEASRGRTG